MKKRFRILLLLILITAISIIFKNKVYAVSVSNTLPDSFETGYTSSAQVSLDRTEDPRYAVFCGQHLQSHAWGLISSNGSADSRVKIATKGADGLYQDKVEWTKEASGNELPNIAGYAFYLSYNLNELNYAYNNGHSSAVYNVLESAIWTSKNDPIINENMAVKGQGHFLSNLATGGNDVAGKISLATKDYSEIYYRMLKYIDDDSNPLKGSLFQTTAADSDGVKAYVDQTTGKYTVGPYITTINPYIRKLSINNGTYNRGKVIKTNNEDNADDSNVQEETVDNNKEYCDAVKALYELLSGGTNYDKYGFGTSDYNYVKFDITKDLENVNILKNAQGEYKDANGNPTVEFVDENGSVIQFPNFTTNNEKKYYIRFTPANDGAICELVAEHNGTIAINPNFRLTYYSSFNGNWARYYAKSISTTVVKIKDLPTDYKSLKDYLDKKQKNGILTYKEENDWVEKSTENGQNAKPSHTTWYDTIDITIPVKYAHGCANPIAVGNSFDLKFRIKYSQPAIVIKTDNQEDQEYKGTWSDAITDGNNNIIGYTPAHPHYGSYDPPRYHTEHTYQALKDWGNSPEYKVLKSDGTEATDEVLTTTENDPNIKDDTQLQIIIQNQQYIYGAQGKSPYMPGIKTTKEYFPNATINMELQGTVWLDQKDVSKQNSYNGVMDDTDVRFPGIQVSLYQYAKGSTTRSSNDTLIATTTTDSNGKYWFYGRKKGTTEPLMNPLRQYYVEFRYNGQLYQDTYYKNDLSTDGKHSNAQEITNDRNAINNRFEKISSSDASYAGLTGENRAFAYNSAADLSFSDYWEKFVETATFTASQVQDPSESDYYKEWDRQKTYDDVYNTLTNSGLEGKAKQYIKDSMINAYTGTTTGNSSNAATDRMARYPSYDKFALVYIDKSASNYRASGTNAIFKLGNDLFNYLYIYNWSQASNVNFGLFARQENDLALQKDVYKATVMVNGQKQEYKYNKKETTLDQYGDKIWTVSLRAADALYNGSTVYDREVRSSDYLYTADENAKNLQIYVTYKIAVKNIGTVDAKVDEIVDYYDANNYEFDGSLNGNQYTIKSRTDHETNSTFVQSFIGNRKGTKINDNLKVYENSQTGIGTNTNQNETLSSSGANYNTLYLTGITDTEGNEWLEPGKTAYVYLTFKVKTDPNTGKPKLDEALTTSNGQTVYSAGKRNMSEINCYETRYTNGQKLPDYIKDDGTLIDYDATHQSAGIVDFNSNPGNLVSQDLLDNGKINYSKADGKQLFNYGTLKKEDDPTIKYTYVENDTDQAPNIRIIIGQGDDGNRAMSGYVYEDSRTETMQSAMIGNGVCEDETKINGVTIKLIELVQNVDGDGMPLGTYSREEEVVPHLFDNNARLTGYDTSRYYSGIGTGRVLYTATDTNSIFYIKSSASLSQLDGKYSLDSMPAGNYYIEFVYGDTDQTVLTNNKINGGNLVIGYQDDGTVNNLLNQYGLNAKSYNGQDFKSTVYQAGISQSGSYRGINGFTNPETQDYNKSDVTNKSYMYYYDIAASSSKQGASDAKDSYYRRQANIDYSATLRNHNSEVLDSFEKLGQVNANEDQATLQRSLINELEAQTYMEARTGIINTEIEYNRKESGTNNKRSSNVYSGNSDDATDSYKIEDIDLGLQERPRSQLMLNKKVSGLSVVLANGQTLFNTTQSANNLAYTEHKYHAYGTADSSNPNAIHYNNNFKDTTDKRLFGVALSGTSKDTPELIQSYIDDEIMEGAQLTVHYLLTVKNVGETDYSDKTFYYTGNENNASANLVKTTPNVVIDYLTNDAKYDQSLQQDENSVWVTATADDLVPSGKSGSSFERDAVNHTYYDKLQTYNTILITQRLATALSPTCAKSGPNSSNTTLTTSGVLTSTTGSNLTYNNLSEIIISSNTVGRRMQFSIVGNQEMSDQSLGDNASENVYTSVDLVTPKEVDADSAQKIVFMPPTGANKNYVPMIIATIIALGFVLAGAIIIRKRNK